MFRFALPALCVLLATCATPAQATDDCVRVDQVRAFAPDTDNSVIVRQGRARFSRIVVAPGCELARADRIAFAQGSAQFYVWGRGNQLIPTSRTTGPTRVCSATPHAYLSVIDEHEDRRPRCRIESVAPSTREEFEATGQVRDNRH